MRTTFRFASHGALLLLGAGEHSQPVAAQQLLVAQPELAWPQLGAK